MKQNIITEEMFDIEGPLLAKEEFGREKSLRFYLLDYYKTVVDEFSAEIIVDNYIKRFVEDYNKRCED